MIILTKLAIFLTCILNSAFVFSANFVDEEGKLLSKYDEVWRFVNKEIGDCPKTIKFLIDDKKGVYSRFVGRPSTVVMALVPGSDRFKMVLAHEVSHICLFAKTKDMSNVEEFRFFDEGIADIIGGRIVGGESNYRKTAFKVAREKVAKNQFSIELIQNWNTYFGKSPNGDYDAYKVGATFIYFVVDRWGKEKLNEFFLSIGKTKDLRTSVLEIFDLPLDQFEKDWISYVKDKK